MKITVTENKPEDVFKEGSFVISRQTNTVFLVTVAARGYDECQDGTFWGIDLSKDRPISGGNYLKSLFEPFHGKIVIEV